MRGEKKVAEELAKERKDVFWPRPVPCGCKVAFDLTDSEAGVTIFVFQTSKNESARMAASNIGWNLSM